MGDINVSSATATQASYKTTEVKNDTKAKEETAVKSEDKDSEQGAVYEKSKEPEKKATYSNNKMSAEDRAALVQQLKQDEINRRNKESKSILSLLRDNNKGLTIIL